MEGLVSIGPNHIFFVGIFGILRKSLVNIFVLILVCYQFVIFCVGFYMSVQHKAAYFIKHYVSEVLKLNFQKLYLSWWRKQERPPLQSSLDLQVSFLEIGAGIS